MKKIMETLKKHRKVFLGVLIAILAISAVSIGLFLHDDGTMNEVKAETYVAYVKDANGTSVQGVSLVLCGEDGSEISWLPYISNSSGKVDFTRLAEEGCYVKVVSVPTGYKVDEGAKYTFNERGEVTIVVAKDDSVYVAQIGDFKYLTFENAIAAANASSKDVVIELLSDLTVKACEIKNSHGSKIVINGNGHIVTTNGGNNVFAINQTGSVAFNNMNIKHNNTGSVVQILSATTVALTDVKIDATEGQMYNYCLFNTMAVEDATTLNLTNVDVKMAVNTEGKDEWSSIIRTGNNGDKKTVNINLTNCNLDTTEATKRSGIVVMLGTTANINLKNSSIKTKDTYAIRAVEKTLAQTMTITNSSLGSKTEPYNSKPIQGYAALIGNKYYLTLQSAADIANSAKQDTTIKIVSDITIATCNINNKNGHLVTIEGQGNQITTNGGNNTFVVGNKVALKNMTINHLNPGSIIHVTELATVDLEDVNLNATEGKTYNWTLINLLAKGDGTTLNLNRVNATMSVQSGGADGYASIVRTGNAGEAKKVTINMTDCNLDTTKATGRSGIAVMQGTTAVVNLNNTNITTKDAFAIRSSKQDINLTNSTVTSLTEKYKNYPIEGYEVIIDGVYYSFQEAVVTASESKEDITLKLLTDFTINTGTINNKNGKLVSIEGNGKIVTTSGGNNAFVVGNRVKFHNMTINHKNTGSAIHITEIATVDLKDVKLKATEGSTYNYCLINVLAKGDETTLNLDGVTATMSVAGRGADDNSSIIRTGNPGDAKTVNINMNNCKLDTTKATGRSGIVVMATTIANIDLNNTTIKTLDVAAIKSNERNRAQTITLNECTLDSVTKEFNKDNEPISGYDAQIGNTVYLRLQDALAVANGSSEDVNIELLSDFTLKGINYIYANTSGKTITIEGNGHKVTTPNSYSYAFLIQQGNVELKDMTIVHKSAANMIQIEANGSTVKLTNVKVDATNPNDNDDKNYRYALINVTKNAALYLTGVTVDMDAPDNGNTDKAILRTGNNGDAKNVSINLSDCNLDASDAVKRNGIVIMKGTIADINLQNTKIKTKNMSAIKSIEQKNGQVTIADDCKLIPGKKAEELDGYVARIGNTWYTSLSTALGVAKTSAEDITITLVSDVVIPDYMQNILENDNQKKITIDGTGHTVFTSNSYTHAFSIKTDAEMKNMTIVHNNAANVILNEMADTTVKLTDVKIDATKVNTNWALINTSVSTNLHFIRTTVDMDAAANDNPEKAIIRTGNDGQIKTVNITLEDCQLDATDAIGRHGIAIMSGTTATVTLNNSTIATKDVVPVLDKTGSATITNTNSVLSCENAIAQINATIYTDFTAALAAANASPEDVTIQLISDVTLQGVSVLQNSNDKVIVVDGNGHKITTASSGYVFSVQSHVEFKNMTIKDKSASELFYIEVADKDISLTDVKIDATEANCNRSLINTKVNADISLTRVTVDMDASANNTENKAIIRTGNDENARNVNITLVDCKLDASDADGRHGIIVMKGTNANISLEGTTIKTMNTNVIKTNEKVNGSVTITDDCKLIAGKKAEELSGYTVQSGNTYYPALNVALSMAKASTEDVTIQLINDLVLPDNTVNVLENDNQKKITIDGNGHVMTTAASGYVFSVKSHVEFKNMTIKDRSVNELIYIEAADKDILLTDVKIDAKEANYNRSLINAKQNADIILTRVTVDMDAAANGTADKAIIRTGNDDVARTVNITLEDCKLDTTGATGRSGIVVMSGTTSTITLKNSSIATKDSCPILDLNGSATILKTKASLSCTDKVAQVGTTLYARFPEALEAANGAVGDVTVDILVDGIIVWQDYTLGKATGKFTIDGNGHQLSTANGNNAFKVDQVGDAEFKNMTIKHTNTGSVIQITKENAVVKLTDVVIDATKPASNFNWALFNMTVSSQLYLTRVDVDMDATAQGGGDGKQSAIIRTGNDDSNASVAKAVTIELVDSTLNAVDAKGRSGILLVDADATINLKDSKILTQNETYCATIQGYSGTRKANITLEGECLLKSGDSTEQSVVIKNLSADSVIATNLNQSAMTAEVSSDEDTNTKQIILEVPVKLYDAFVSWIKKFAEEHGWDLKL